MLNLFANLPQPGDVLASETFENILDRPGVSIERIVSTGQCSAPGYWYDQPRGEWVLVLQGAAGLLFEDEAFTRMLGPGDCVDIAPHRRHRVEWTALDTPTVWLAVHYDVPASF